MTFSLLAYDRKSGTYGGAAATGSLCVGGWVLRGDPEAGLSASQGTFPSTLWGEAVLARMKSGTSAVDAVAAITAADPGRAHRQLTALDVDGGTGAFTGAQSVSHAGTHVGNGCVAAGNMLSNDQVLPAMTAAFAGTCGDIAFRLFAALKAAEAAGSDSRGLLSAALLVISKSRAPLTLRIDFDPDPIPALENLHRLATSEPYHSWTGQVPTLENPTHTGDTTG